MLQKVRLAIITALLILTIAVPSLSISSVKGQTGQTTFYSQGNLIVQVVCANSPVTNWQTPQKYTVTFQIMRNGTVNLNDENNQYISQHPSYAQTIPNGNVTVDATITTNVMQSESSTGYSYSASGSLLEVEGNWLIPTNNGTETSWDIVLPTDNQWHTVATETCYYQPPTLQYPNGQLQQVGVQFDVNVYEDLVDSATPTPPPNGGMTITATYQGANLGYSQTVIPVYQAPLLVSSTISPTTTPTSTPTVAPTQTATQTPTQAPVNNSNPTPTPSVPEFPITTVLAVFLLASLFVVILKKR